MCKTLYNKINTYGSLPTICSFYEIWYYTNTSRLVYRYA